MKADELSKDANFFNPVSETHKWQELYAQSMSQAAKLVSKLKSVGILKIDTICDSPLRISNGITLTWLLDY